MARGQGGLGALGFAFTMFSMAACLPLFFLGPMAYNMGLSLFEALLAALIGNGIVAAAIAIVGRYGVATGEGFSSQALGVFGNRAGKLMIALRGLVGALWFGVEAYNGALALVMIILLALGVTGSQLVSRAVPLIPLALAAYLASMFLVLRRGVGSIGLAASIAGPLLLAYFAWLALWLSTRAGSLTVSHAGVGLLSPEFLVYLAIQTNWWATVAVNASDLTRLARSWRAVWIGTFAGMVGGQLLGTYLGYELAAYTGKVLPQEIIAAYAPGAAAIALGLIFAFLAPWTTDITANVPALLNILKDIVGLDWAKAVAATIAAGFILAPWWALSQAQGIVDYVASFAAAYGTILGPILGPLLANPMAKRMNKGRHAVVAFAAGLAASYALAALINSFEKVEVGPLTLLFPSGPTWYAGVAVSFLAYIATVKISIARETSIERIGETPRIQTDYS